MRHPSLPVLTTPRPRRVARATCGAVKVTVVAVLAGVYLTSGPGWSSSGSAGALPAEPQPPAPVQQLLRRHDCSLIGYSGEQVPSSAIVRSAAGRLHFVDFDTAWRVYTRHGAATLVAVCLDDPPR